ncbi:ATP-grasp domain-containing protein [Chengkuizengella axinellae]|uniref:ATP-grasp domain-containing protein n=1 Tax=Chengkuizengella axinellae TaxID=3064388 RepID=A0ABT9J1H3_9BACL|nr:ATP-grasp domain-containing protein [Chengkuizengella sp. 2205SS18-9]MDP5274859.1 ATP-grasp domain-containing protein [Chengkuizengella sp. 2205SS18-9]
MSILIINNYKKYLYSELFPEVVDKLVVLSSHPLPDSDQFLYFELIEDMSNAFYAELRAIELHQTYFFTSIVAEDEFDLVLAGRLRDHLGIPGQSEASAIAFRDKVLMKNYLKDELILPFYRPLATFYELLEFIEQHGYPVVVKPRDGAASVNLNILHNKEELIEFAKKPWEHNLMVESYIAGEMYHVDALIKNDETVILSISKYINGCLAFTESKSLGSYQLHPDEIMYQRLSDYFYKVLSFYPTPNITAYHLEVYHTTQDEFVFCEIASRIGGGYILETVQHAFDVDMSRYWLRHLCELNESRGTPVPKELSGWLLIPPQKAKLIFLPESIPFNWVKKYVKSGKEGMSYDNPNRSIERVAGFVITDNTSHGLLEKLKFLDKWYRDQLMWEDIGIV